jgi:hypothetical protein
MHIQSGKAGGPDVSGATETNQAFLASGDMKVTVTGNPGEKKTLKLSTNQSDPFKTVSVTQTQKSNGHVGWGNAGGTYHANGKSAGQGAQIANFHPGQKLGTAFPHYDTADHLIIEIGSDGAPMTVTFGEGLPV